MATKANAAAGKAMYYIQRNTRFNNGLGQLLPEEYRTFWNEWKVRQPTPLHYIPKEGKYEFHEGSGTIYPVQNVPLSLKYPKEFDEGIWGGEAVVQGFTKKKAMRRRVPHFWVPVLQKNILYSEILDKHMRIVVTERTMELVHKHYGFDHYLLKTPACDLRSLLALRLKKQMLIALMDKTLYPHDPVKREEVYDKYKDYLTDYTRTYLDWYGLSYPEACKRVAQMQLNKHYENAVPAKIQFRKKLIEQLKDEQEEIDAEKRSKSWFQRINPFSSDANPLPR